VSVDVAAFARGVAQGAVERHAQITERMHATVGTDVPRHVMRGRDEFGQKIRTETIRKAKRRGGKTAALGTFASNPTPVGAAVTAVTQPRAVLETLVWVFLLVGAMMWGAWFYLVPKPVREIAGWAAKHHGQVYGDGGALDPYWLGPVPLDPFGLRRLVSCDTATTAVAQPAPAGEEPKMVRGIAWMAHDAGNAVSQVAHAKITPSDVRSTIMSGARDIGRIFGEIESGIKGEPNAPEQAAAASYRAAQAQQQTATAQQVAACGKPCPTSSGTALNASVTHSTRLTADQTRNATIIAQVGASLGPRAQTIAIATAMQESGLRNLHYGDRDSQGLFQQRPSQGWGTVAQVTTPAFAAATFYRHLQHVPHWRTMPLTQAAQAVQHSAFPDAYAKHEGLAASLVASMLPGARVAQPVTVQAAACATPATLRTT